MADTRDRWHLLMSHLRKVNDNIRRRVADAARKYPSSLIDQLTDLNNKEKTISDHQTPKPKEPIHCTDVTLATMYWDHIQFTDYSVGGGDKGDTTMCFFLCMSYLLYGTTDHHDWIRHLLYCAYMSIGHMAEEANWCYDPADCGDFPRQGLDVEVYLDKTYEFSMQFDDK